MGSDAAVCPDDSAVAQVFDEGHQAYYYWNTITDEAPPRLAASPPALMQTMQVKWEPPAPPALPAALAQVISEDRVSMACV